MNQLATAFAVVGRAIVLHKFGGLAVTLARRYAVSGLETDDLVQEARLAILEHAEKYEPSFGVSLKTFLGRRIRDALRKFHSAYLDRDLVSLDEDIGWDGDEPLTRHDVIGTSAEQEADMHVAKETKRFEAQSARASKTTSRGTSVRQEVVRLRSGGMTFAEIAKALGKTENAVTLQWHRAQKRLAETAPS